MKPKDILEKLDKGEITKETVSEEVEKLTPEDKLEFNKLLSEEVTETIKSFTGTRKERDRARQQVKDEEARLAELKSQEGNTEGDGNTNPEPSVEPEADPLQPLREENLKDAIGMLKKEHPNLNNEDFEKVINRFKKNDTGKINTDHIFNELEASYAYENKDEVLSAAEEKAKREAEAEEAIIQGAGGIGGGTPPEPGKQFDPKITALAKAAEITNEQAERIENQGYKRVHDFDEDD